MQDLTGPRFPALAARCSDTCHMYPLSMKLEYIPLGKAALALAFMLRIFKFKKKKAVNL